MHTRIGVGPVEPDLIDWPVIREQFIKLIQEVTIIIIHFVGAACETRGVAGDPRWGLT